MKPKLVCILIFAMIVSLFSGCWDRKDIETRAYVLGVAIDKYPPNPHAGENGTEGETPPEEEDKLEMMEFHTGKAGDHPIRRSRQGRDRRCDRFLCQRSGNAKKGKGFYQ